MIHSTDSLPPIIFYIETMSTSMSALATFETQTSRYDWKTVYQIICIYLSFCRVTQDYYILFDLYKWVYSSTSGIDTAYEFKKDVNILCESFEIFFATSFTLIREIGFTQKEKRLCK